MSAVLQPVRLAEPAEPAVATDAYLVSVIVATYNRPRSVARLLAQLAEQTLAPDRFEVIVVDDGSTPPVRDALAPLLAPDGVPYRLRVVAQPNAGPGAARHHAATLARGTLLVIVDDDVRIGRDFLEAHAEAHGAAHDDFPTPGPGRVVLGRLRPEPDTPLPLFERFHLATLDRLAADVARGVQRPVGSNVYTGNVSMRRAAYEAVGGFDRSLRLSEDAELGMRLDRAGAEIVLSDAAVGWHASDHTSLAKWMRRSAAYGAADLRVSTKHGGRPDTNPWRFLFAVNPVSRPLMLLAALAPAVARPLAWAIAGVATALATLGAERLALAAVTLAYGLQYFAGVRAGAGSRRAACSGLRRYLNAVRDDALPPLGRVLKCVADTCADHEALHRTDVKYRSVSHDGAASEVRSTGLLSDLVQRIGLQMMAAYRAMRLLRALGLMLPAKIASRLIRHVYGAELHWDADLAPGVVLVHGTGLVIGHGARVGPGCILFQHVTLGESMHPDGHGIGAPALEADVHVGPGAALLGPITVGRGTKVSANAVLMRSAPPLSVVAAAAVTVRPRRASAEAVHI